MPSKEFERWLESELGRCSHEGQMLTWYQVLCFLLDDQITLPEAKKAYVELSMKMSERALAGS
jgi:hypothetical protein